MIANCPCLVHTESRGYDWVVFRRQPDRTPTLYYDVEQTESEDGDNEQMMTTSVWNKWTLMKKRKKTKPIVR